MDLRRVIIGGPAYLRSRLQGSRTFQASVWTTSIFALTQILRVGANLIITRLLAPEMFGVMSIVQVVNVILSLLCDVGLQPLVVQSRRGDEPTFLDTIWSIQIIRGICIWLVGLLIALVLLVCGRSGLLPAASAWSTPELPAVMAVALFSAVVGGFQSSRLLTAYRNMALKKVVLIELIAQVAGLVAMIALAFATRSIWSLVAAFLVTSLVSTMLSHVWLSGHRDGLAWDREALAEIYRSGGWILVSSLTFVAAASADRLMLAGYVDSTQLGLYAIAYNLVVLFDTIGSRLFNSVVLPTLSEVARNDATVVRAPLLRQRLYFDTGYLVVAGMLFATGAAVIHFLFDDRYASAGPILQILSCGLIFSRYQIFSSAYMALGRPELMARMNIIKLVSIVVLMPVAYRLFGFDGVLVAVAIHAAPSIAAMFWVNRKLGLNDFRFEVMVLPAWILGFALGVGGLRLLHWMFG